ncbi:hypothetical protein EX30DRAFT_382435 [Ascodesmis nigricans]|uniref:Uncharacterized protein n=1 Tax=Ascodesmis nigricans TaxID=341454 RepID=A0A4S2MSR9_9PEZI|nr:hypothetical protein EX30DRAFT_382435 [Ascodesmis nigricans]
MKLIPSAQRRHHTHSLPMRIRPPRNRPHPRSPPLSLPLHFPLNLRLQLLLSLLLLGLFLLRQLTLNPPLVFKLRELPLALLFLGFRAFAPRCGPASHFPVAVRGRARGRDGGGAVTGFTLALGGGSLGSGGFGDGGGLGAVLRTVVRVLRAILTGLNIILPVMLTVIVPARLNTILSTITRNFHIRTRTTIRPILTSASAPPCHSLEVLNQLECQFLALSTQKLGVTRAHVVVLWDRATFKAHQFCVRQCTPVGDQEVPEVELLSLVGGGCVVMGCDWRGLRLGVGQSGMAWGLVGGSGGGEEFRHVVLDARNGGVGGVSGWPGDLVVGGTRDGVLRLPSTGITGVGRGVGGRIDIVAGLINPPVRVITDHGNRLCLRALEGIGVGHAHGHGGGGRGGERIMVFVNRAITIVLLVVLICGGGVLVGLIAVEVLIMVDFFLAVTAAAGRLANGLCTRARITLRRSKADEIHNDADVQAQ